MIEIVDLKHTVNKETGVRVIRLGRHRIAYYKPNEQLLILYTEAGQDKQGRYVELISFPLTLFWDSPNRKIQVSEKEREEIKVELQKSFTAKDINSYIEFQEKEIA